MLSQMPRRVAFGIALLIFPLPAQADVRILSSPGGAVDAYLAAFARVRQSGERVIIVGPCLSACTLLLSTVPRSRICVTRRAVLGFHAPRWYYPGTGQTMRASPVLLVDSGGETRIRQVCKHMNATEDSARR